MRTLAGVVVAAVCAAVATGVSGARAAEAPSGYPPVVAGRTLVFPADTGAHPDYRTEWWYVTGWLTDGDGVERGFQVTFFRVRTRIGDDNPSRFAPRQLVFAHAAVADPAEGRLLHAERVERALAPLAGAALGRTDAWIGDWRLRLDGERYVTRIDAGRFAFALELVPDGPPVRNGREGFSQKAPDPINASYYYSRPQLAVRGTLRVDGREHDVTGHAWLDHEWSSELLPAGARGWDWIGINLHDGGALMAFQMRDDAGRAMWAAATLRDAAGAVRVLAPDEVAFSPLRRWRSPRTGADYPVEWQITAGERRLRLQPLMDDQELDSRRSTGAVYWEGAVRMFEDEREIGQGYLEMTGYAERLRM